MRSVFVEPPLWQNVIRCSNREIDLRDFKQRRFYATHIKRKLPLCIFGRDFDQIFGLSSLYES